MMASELEMLLNTLKRTLTTEDTRAFTMPGEFYTSEQLLDLELNQLFRKKWICVGREEEVSDVGSYFSTELAGEPLIIVRTTIANIMAISNVCRHRAMPLVDGAGRTKKFTCSYHAWTYDLNGKLIRAHGVNEDHSDYIKQCRLPEYGCEVWQGFIFVNLDSSAESFLESDTVRQLDPFVKNMHIEDMRLIYSSEQEWDANWKCLVENFLEGYHLSTVHRKTLHPYTPTELSKYIEPFADVFGFYSNYPDSAPQRGVAHPDTTDEEKRRSLMLGIGPSSVFGISGFKVTFNLIQPVSPTRLRTKIGMLAHRSEAVEAKQYEKSGVELFKRTFAEDKEQLTKVMRGLQSINYQSSVLANQDYEGTIWDFYKYLARNIHI